MDLQLSVAQAAVPVPPQLCGTADVNTSKARRRRQNTCLASQPAVAAITLIPAPCFVPAAAAAVQLEFVLLGSGEAEHEPFLNVGSFWGKCGHLLVLSAG